MVKLSKVNKLSASKPDVLSLLPSFMILPDEDASAYEALKQVFIDEFNPETPYQVCIVNDIVNNEWEKIRCRNIRDDILVLFYRADLADKISKFGKKAGSNLSGLGHEENQILDAVFGKDSDLRNKALAKLSEWKIDLNAVKAGVYMTAANEIEIYEKRLTEYDKRRNKLRDEFDRLKALNAKVVEDAVIVKSQ